MIDDLWVRDFMTPEVVTCSFDTSLDEVVTELQTRLFSCLIIVDQKIPIGIITERDLVRIFSNLLDSDGWRQLIVIDYMTKNPQTIYEDLTLMEAVAQMTLDRIRQAPIVNNQQELVGLLTQSDVIRGFHSLGLAEKD